MSRKKKVRLGDKEIEGTVVDINSSQENWNQYLLSDGCVLRLKAVATEIIRADEEYDPEGNPLYLVKSTNIIAVSGTEELKRRP